ncbi:MAG: sugar nucleotide-binding protein, partial [Candidatus Neomarinimicrobiota bacterium]
DYVFDGRSGPYGENDPVNPLSVYGRHKLQAENWIRGTYPAHLILRVTNVYGDEMRGKNFVAFLIREARKGEAKTLRLPIDQYASPVNAADIGRACARLIRDGKRGLYHLSAGEYLNRVQLAEKVLRYFPGNRLRIAALPTKKLGQDAPRPLKGGLKNDKFLGEYPDFQFSTLDDYLRKQHGI